MLALVFGLHRGNFETCASKTALQALIGWFSYIGIHPWVKVACTLFCAVGLRDALLSAGCNLFFKKGYAKQDFRMRWSFGKSPLLDGIPQLTFPLLPVLRDGATAHAHML